MLKMEKLFVYGTLKKGFGNHHYLADARFLCTARTVEKYAMYVNGIPFVVRTPKVSQIIGELYEIDDETMDRIDRLEGHPKFYCREKTTIETEDGQKTEAWIYITWLRSGRLVEDGFFYWMDKL